MFFKRIAAGLLSVVLSMTLCVPAFAAPGDTPSYACGLEEHVHSDACRTDDILAALLSANGLSGYDEIIYVVHQHGEACYEDGWLVCQLADSDYLSRYPNVRILHSHDGSCSGCTIAEPGYGADFTFGQGDPGFDGEYDPDYYVDGMPGGVRDPMGGSDTGGDEPSYYVHGPGCDVDCGRPVVVECPAGFDGSVLSCGKAEHVHSDACLSHAGTPSPVPPSPAKAMSILASSVLSTRSSGLDFEWKDQNSSPEILSGQTVQVRFGDDAKSIDYGPVLNVVGGAGTRIAVPAYVDARRAGDADASHLSPLVIANLSNGWTAERSGDEYILTNTASSVSGIQLSYRFDTWWTQSGKVIAFTARNVDTGESVSTLGAVRTSAKMSAGIRYEDPYFLGADGFDRYVDRWYPFLSLFGVSESSMDFSAYYYDVVSIYVQEKGMQPHDVQVDIRLGQYPTASNSFQTGWGATVEAAAYWPSHVAYVSWFDASEKAGRTIRVPKSGITNLGAPSDMAAGASGTFDGYRFTVSPPMASDSLGPVNAKSSIPGYMVAALVRIPKAGMNGYNRGLVTVSLSQIGVDGDVQTYDVLRNSLFDVSNVNAWKDGSAEIMDISNVSGVDMLKSGSPVPLSISMRGVLDGTGHAGAEGAFSFEGLSIRLGDDTYLLTEEDYRITKVGLGVSSGEGSVWGSVVNGDFRAPMFRPDLNDGSVSLSCFMDGTTWADAGDVPFDDAWIDYTYSSGTFYASPATQSFSGSTGYPSRVRFTFPSDGTAYLRMMVYLDFLPGEGLLRFFADHPSETYDMDAYMGVLLEDGGGTGIVSRSSTGGFVNESPIATDGDPMLSRTGTDADTLLLKESFRMSGLYSQAGFAASRQLYVPDGNGGYVRRGSDDSAGSLSYSMVNRADGISKVRYSISAGLYSGNATDNSVPVFAAETHADTVRSVFTGTDSPYAFAGQRYYFLLPVGFELVEGSVAPFTGFLYWTDFSLGSMLEDTDEPMSKYLFGPANNAEAIANYRPVPLGRFVGDHVPSRCLSYETSMAGGRQLVTVTAMGSKSDLDWFNTAFRLTNYAGDVYYYGGGVPISFEMVPKAGTTLPSGKYTIQCASEYLRADGTPYSLTGFRGELRDSLADALGVPSLASVGTGTDRFVAFENAFYNDGGQGGSYAGLSVDGGESADVAPGSAYTYELEYGNTTNTTDQVTLFIDLEEGGSLGAIQSVDVSEELATVWINRSAIDVDAYRQAQRKSGDLTAANGWIQVDWKTAAASAYTGARAVAIDASACGEFDSSDKAHSGFTAEIRMAAPDDPAPGMFDTRLYFFNRAVNISQDWAVLGGRASVTAADAVPWGGGMPKTGGAGIVGIMAFGAALVLAGCALGFRIRRDRLS